MVDLLKRKKHVKCKRMFTIKNKVNGTTDRYKLRLVVKGYTQTYTIDYQEILAPII